MIAKLVLTLVSPVVALVAAILGCGGVRWAANSRRLRTRLAAARLPVEPRRVDLREVDGLPDPVQRYFRRVLTDGHPLVAAVRLRDRCNIGDTVDRWKPIASDQRVITRRPGFVWDARVRMMPGLTVRVHDAYVAGEGILQAAVLGLLPVVDARGTPDLALGELMRFAAEAVWYPTALLPSQGVRWEGVDARSARATLADGPVNVTLLFTFDETGRIDAVRARARGRTVGKEVVPTPWQGRFWGYVERGGMQVPRYGEVAWL